jgi:hypothetical protein
MLTKKQKKLTQTEQKKHGWLYHTYYKEHKQVTAQTKAHLKTSKRTSVLAVLQNNLRNS